MITDFLPKVAYVVLWLPEPCQTFVLDEVKTGFRIARGGAQEVYGVVPDLATYAKAIGNGYRKAMAAGGTA